MFGLLRRPFNSSRSFGAGRILWLLMLLVHAPALVGAWRGVFVDGAEAVRLTSLLGLTLSSAFFALKLAGLPLLRFERSRRSVVTVVLAIALMHANAVEAAAPGVVVPEEIPLAAGVLFAAGLSCVQNFVQSLLASSRRGRRGVTPPLLVIDSPQCERRPLLLAARVCIPRSPPG